MNFKQISAIERCLRKAGERVGRDRCRHNIVADRDRPRAFDEQCGQGQSVPEFVAVLRPESVVDDHEHQSPDE